MSRLRDQQQLQEVTTGCSNKSRGKGISLSLETCKLKPNFLLHRLTPFKKKEELTNSLRKHKMLNKHDTLFSNLIITPTI